MLEGERGSECVVDGEIRGQYGEYVVEKREEE